MAEQFGGHVVAARLDGGDRDVGEVGTAELAGAGRGEVGVPAGHRIGGAAGVGPAADEQQVPLVDHGRPAVMMISSPVASILHPDGGVRLYARAGNQACRSAAWTLVMRSFSDAAGCVTDSSYREL
ncbi:hypothetical protein PUR61_27440 [Streptomyces sp. BE20]|uniref:hypothetical protein n=1 Tax=Streptomyces sp. BE20 TaxID=3002525 RepID=UPI002E789A30|nr:hypothetical protein [Streptomyces sp. BE20]MEE1825895.1 hypothetical protein [Streptomyces sp. BE20]